MENNNVEKVVIPTKYEANKAYTPVLLKKYNEESAPALQAKFNYKSTMQIPRLVKVVINMGVGDATQNAKLIEAAVEDLTAISGQKPVITKAKKSIAVF